jgi:SPP1 gp7 family putative phage head morphogenesis protein
MPRPGSKRRQRRLRRPLFPSGISVAYAAELYKMLSYARELVREKLGERLQGFVARVRQDAKQPPGRRVNKILDAISDAFFRRYSHERLEALAAKYMARTAVFQRNAFERFAQEELGVPLSGAIDRGIKKTIDAATARNVSLIKSIPQRYFEDVEKAVTQGLTAGRRHEEISKDLEERFSVAQSSARLVARDQTLSFYAEVNKARQENLGVTEYIWRTVNDERVRSVHSEFDGNRYSWDDPPGDGSPQEGTHPGTAVLCRCWAQPIIEDLT